MFKEASKVYRLCVPLDSILKWLGIKNKPLPKHHLQRAPSFLTLAIFKLNSLNTEHHLQAPPSAEPTSHWGFPVYIPTNHRDSRALWLVSSNSNSSLKNVSHISLTTQISTSRVKLCECGAAEASDPWIEKGMLYVQRDRPPVTPYWRKKEEVFPVLI